jgi:hypothetical protein
MSLILGILASRNQSGTSPSGTLIGPTSHQCFGLVSNNDNNYWSYGPAATTSSVPGAGTISWYVKTPSNFSSLTVNKGLQDGSGTTARNTRIISGSPDPVGGGIVVGGLFNILAASQYQPMVVKINSSGDITWARSPVQTGTDNYITIRSVSASKSTGSVGFVATGPVTTTSVAIVGLYNSSGVLQWQRSFTNTNFSSAFGAGGATSCYVDSSDNVYISGNYTTYIPPGSGSNGFGSYIAKYNSSGTLLWSKVFLDSSGSTSSQVRTGAIYVDETNNKVYLTGSTKQSGLSGIYFWISKIDTNGTLIWSKYNTSTFGQQPDPNGQVNGYKGIAVDSNENVYLSGYNRTTDGFGGQMILTKYNSSGVLQSSNLFTYKLPSPSTSVQYLYSENNNIVLKDNDIYLAGWTFYSYGNHTPIMKTTTDMPVGKTYSWESIIGSITVTSNSSATASDWVGTYTNGGASSVSTIIADTAAAVSVTTNITTTSTPTYS